MPKRAYGAVSALLDGVTLIDEKWENDGMIEPILRRARPALAFLAFMASPLTATPASQGLIAAEQQRLDAQVAQDVAMLDRAIAPDAVYIHANGVVQGKVAYLADVQAGKSRYRSIEVGERSATLYGAVGVTHSVLTLNVGVDRRIVARATGVYVRRDGRWQVISWQSTPVPDGK